MRTEVFITKSSWETQELAIDFAKRLIQSNRRVVALFGDLGSGKTTFIQGLAKGLGIKRRIISPTFIIVRSYGLQAQNSKGKTQSQNLKLKSFEYFYHIDLYRVENVKEVERLGLEEILKNPKNIVAIEWAEKMGGLLPKKRWDFRFEHLDGDKRKITVARAI